MSDKQTQHSTLWYACSVEVLAGLLDTDVAAGLTDEEGLRRLVAHGPNELPAATLPSPIRLFIAQFSSLVIWILIGASLVSGLLQEWIDAVAIMAIVSLNAVLGFIQEYKAERSLAALKMQSVPVARVLRDGRVRSIPAREVVPGDMLVVEAGDHVPADARLFSATAMRTQEATLTGESAPVEKSIDVVEGERVPVGDQRNMLFLGTDVTAGKGRAIVVATGIHTELGHIASLIQEARAAPTPLQRRLDQLGTILLLLTLGVVTIVFFLGLLRGETLVEMFLTAVSLAVAAIPESLPAILTITLALGTTTMAARHALIRHLPAVETLGSTTVICTDKTGTLTKNAMTVTRLYLDGFQYEVTGEGYTPTGGIRALGSSIPQSMHGLDDLLQAGALCNDARLVHTPDGWSILGDPTEGALLVAAAKRSLWKDHLEARQPVLGEVPFDPQRKLMTVVRRVNDEAIAYVKGAPDVLLQRCTHRLTVDGLVIHLDEESRATILTANEAFAREALRVLALSRRPLQRVPDEFRSEHLEHDLIWLGLAAMKDPLRAEAKEAVRACNQAGIRTVMITGDHKETALAIARELGIANRHGSLSGVEMDHLSDAALTARVEQIAVYSRVSASHKLRVVKAWQARGAIVAMTGDGVNDAPAVKEADIGVAMGLSGTDVTKEASDMIVTDDNFASIAAAVEEGRGIYENIRKAVHYLLSCNVSEITLMLLASLFALPLPLLPIQILWINLVTDGFPALALAVDPITPDLMQRPPRSPQQRFLTARRVRVIIVQGLFLGLIALSIFSYSLYGLNQRVEQARTMTFTVLVLVQLFHAFNCRSDRYSLFTLGLWTNGALVWAVSGSLLLQTGITLTPWVRDIFDTALPDPRLWQVVLALGLLPVMVTEIWKALRFGRSLS